MGRQVRRVPANWQHPKDEAGNYIPLHDGKDYEPESWDEEWNGARPDPKDYMPRWTDAERTHLMMYEDTTEGTPISPAFETPEELARWLTDNNASAFADMVANYDWWLTAAKGGRCYLRVHLLLDALTQADPRLVSIARGQINRKGD